MNHDKDIERLRSMNEWLYDALCADGESVEFFRSVADTLERLETENNNLRSDLAAERERNKWGTAEVTLARLHQAYQQIDKLRDDLIRCHIQLASADAALRIIEGPEEETGNE